MKTIEEFKSKMEVLVEGLDTKKMELRAHLETQDSLEGDEAIAEFEAKTATLIEEINLLEETANREYKKFRAVNPVAFNLEMASKSVNDDGSVNVGHLEELLTNLSVKTSEKKSSSKKSIGDVIGDYVVNNVGTRNQDDFWRTFGSIPMSFKFNLDASDKVGEAEVKSLASVKTLYSNSGAPLINNGNPVPGFQGYGCSVFEIEDGCPICIEPRNFRDFLTVRNMPTGNIIQYDYPLSRDNNAAAVLEHINNPYPTVVQSGRKPESTFTYATAKVYLSKIAHWIEATDDVLDDCTRIAERINSELERGLTEEVDRQLIAGSGTSGELRGLLLQPGLLTLNGTTLTAGVATPNIWDKLYIAMLELEQNCAKVDGVIINPADRAKVALAKDDNGNYLFPQAGSCDVTGVGCLTLKTSPDVPVGTAIIGEFRNNWIYYVRKNLEISVGMKGTDFIDNNKTFLAEIRGAALLRCPDRVAIVTNI